MSTNVNNESKAGKPFPFMIYMGGKRKMLKDINPNIPSEYRNFHEPFLGGGAVAIDQMASYAALENPKPRKFILSDYSPKVIDAWTAVKDFPEETAALLKTMLGNHCRSNFIEIREWDREGLLESRSLVERGARFIYLMQTCYGGAVQESKQGFLKMNFRWLDDYEHGHRPYDFENMFAVSALLNKLDVEIRLDSYETVLDRTGYGDFVYLDPPYDPKSDKGETLTTDYVGELPCQQKIHDVTAALTAKGAMTLMSNSDTARIRGMYEGWACSRPDHRWGLNTSRKPGQEILIANWRLADKLTATYGLAA
jgi:DNA adenine methylase